MNLEQEAVDLFPKPTYNEVLEALKAAYYAGTCQRQEDDWEQGYQRGWQEGWQQGWDASNTGGK